MSFNTMAYQVADCRLQIADCRLQPVLDDELANCRHHLMARTYLGTTPTLRRDSTHTVGGTMVPPNSNQPSHERSLRAIDERVSPYFLKGLVLQY